MAHLTLEIASLILRHRRRVLWTCVGLAGLTLLWLGVGRVVRSISYPDSDFMTFWLGARFILTHQNPYDSSAWIQGHWTYGAVWVSDPAYIYPLPLAVLMTPLGGLSLRLAFQIWMFLSALMILAAVWLATGLRFERSQLPYLIAWLIGACLFRPAIVIVRNGQIGGALLLALVAACLLASLGRDFTAGFVLGVLSLKPALGFPILGLVGVWGVLSRRWRLFAGAGVTLAGLLLMGWLVNPGWMGQLAAWGSPKLWVNTGFFPTAWGIGMSVCGGEGACRWLVGAALAGSGLAIFVWALAFGARSLSMWEAASLAVPAALFASPYVGAYDLSMLLLPIGYGLRRLKRSGGAYLLIASLPLWIDLAALVLVLIAARIGLDQWGGLLDILVLGMAWIALRPDQHIPGASPSGPQTPPAASLSAETLPRRRLDDG